MTGIVGRRTAAAHGNTATGNEANKYLLQTSGPGTATENARSRSNVSSMMANYSTTTYDGFWIKCCCCQADNATNSVFFASVFCVCVCVV